MRRLLCSEDADGPAALLIQSSPGANPKRFTHSWRVNLHRLHNLTQHLAFPS